MNTRRTAERELKGLGLRSWADASRVAKERTKLRGPVQGPILHRERRKYMEVRQYEQSRMQHFFLIQRQVTPVIPVQLELIQDLLVIYILTNFGTNWSRFADARV